MRFRRVILSISLLLIAALACNMPGSPAPTKVPDLAATITAQALLLQNPVNNSAAIGTSSTVLVGVIAPTNCRNGPSQSYGLVFTANPGTQFQVIGKYTPGNYWIINNPAGGTCWLWGENATVTGNAASLPEFPAPASPVRATKTPKPPKQPTSTASGGGGPINPPVLTLVPVLPSAPGNLTQTRSCAGGFNGLTPIWLEDVNIDWGVSAGASGYRVYKNNGLISTLPLGATSFHIQLRYDQGTGGPLYDNFGVEAFNDSGASTRPSVDVPRCP